MSMKRVDKIIRKVPNGPKKKRYRKDERASCPLCGKIDRNPKVTSILYLCITGRRTKTEHFTCECGCKWDVETKIKRRDIF